MKRIFAPMVQCLSICAVTLSVPFVFGDTLELKNGQMLDGKYEGGSAQTIRFNQSGQTQSYPVTDVVALSFSKTGANAPAPGTAAQPNAAPVAAAATTIPQGTMLQARLDQPIDSSHDQPGKQFTGVLDQPLVVNGASIAPAGTKVYGQISQAEQAGRLAGQSSIAIVLTGIDINGKNVPLVTEPFQLQGQSEGRKTARRVGAGAAIGGIANGGEGAAKGAAVGGALSAGKGQAINLPVNTLVEFRLLRPATVQ